MALFSDRSKKVSNGKSHLNFMGGRSFTLTSPLTQLRLAASSCFFGEPMYYHRDESDTRPMKARSHVRLDDDAVAHLRATLDAVDPQSWRKLTPSELIESAIDLALDFDPKATLDEAVRLRNEEHMRTTPQVILVRAARHEKVRGTGLVRAYAPRIIIRADEPAVGLAYQLHRFGKPIPNALKRAWADALARFGAYGLAKYRLEGKAVKTVDVVNLVHAKSDAVSALAKGELKTTDQTWEAIVSARGSNADAWRDALPRMGHLALLRNLRNMLDAGLSAEELTQPLLATAKNGMALPFRYVSAHQALDAFGPLRAPSEVKRSLDACLRESIGELPRFDGRMMALVDNSGSAQRTTTSTMGTMTIAQIGNLTGVLAAMCSDDGHVGVFGDRLETFRVSPRSSVFGELANANRLAESIGGATENGVWLFFDQALRRQEKWDTIFVMSDMQAGHGGLYGTDPKKYAAFAWQDGRHIDVARLVAEYRRRVNPAVRVFFVQIAGYKDTLVPEFYARTYVLGGWGEGILRFAAEMARLDE